jgi:MoxR-like ATPase
VAARLLMTGTSAGTGSPARHEGEGRVMPAQTTEQMSEENAKWFAETFGKLAANVGKAVLGKPQAIELTFISLLAGGHMLLEDMPGTGKTSLARAVANTVQGSHGRIQFTPDMLPSDVTGVSIYDQRSGEFDFRPGPIFANIVLADEINRASPKTQSALLEVMEEQKVTVDNRRHDVPSPFMVIATQNPIEQAGTYRLPEAQLDRFLVRTSLGYPDNETSVAILADSATRDRAAMVKPLIAAKAVVDMAALGSTVHVDPSVLSYVSRIAEETRRAAEVRLGVSIRGCLALVRCAKVRAASEGRNYVVPDDVKSLVEPVFGHRILLDPEAEFSGTKPLDVLWRIVDDVKPPAERVGS